MNLISIFDAFSLRPEAVAKPHHEVPEKTRNRIFLWWKSTIGVSMMFSDMWNAFWSEIHGVLQMRHGTPRLNQGRLLPPPDDAILFLSKCPGDQFLDFLEDLFRTQFYNEMRLNSDEKVNEVNELLRVDNLPYYLTKLVMETSQIERRGRPTTSWRIVAFPKIIMRESEFMHANAMEPALQLLQNPAFANVNAEFMSALEDFRKGDYSDSLTKCGSSFESMMKIICKTKGWGYKETDTAGPLIKTILANTKLEGYFDSLLIIVATLRNKLSSAHGGGDVAKTVPQHLARYALNVTASAMIMLVDEAGT